MTTASITTPAPASALELLSEHACFGGAQRFYRHASSAIGLPMRFSVYLPPQALAGERCAALVYLAGLTCTEETFAIKAGAQRVAAREGLILIAPDTSPRGAGVPGETDNWDFGVGAGFYLDATQAPWRTHYRMESYVADELIDTVVAALPVDARRIGIFGHSMGARRAYAGAAASGAVPLGVGLCADRASVHLPMGHQSLHRLPRRRPRRLGSARRHAADAAGTRPVPGRHPHRSGRGRSIPRRTAVSRRLCRRLPGRRPTARLRRHPGYDHGYYFIASFIEDHLLHHAAQLR